MLLVVIYLAFISLGLPDSLLGSAWPVMHTELGASLAQGGFISMIVSAGTISSALATDKLRQKFGTGVLTLASVALTAIALFGFSFAKSYEQLLLWAIPYGLGAGAVDAALNAYVALHYKAMHMNWLHCMWGIGASLGPLIMGWQMGGSGGWQGGYRVIGMLQCLLVAVLALNLKSWVHGSTQESEQEVASVSRTNLIKQPGVIYALIGFFCYCALESSCGLWAASFMVMAKGVSPTDAALYSSLFFIGITAGRALSGFLTLRFNGHQLQHLGEVIIATGVIVMVVAPTSALVGVGLVLVGLGCAPIYPQMIQLTPERFGDEAASSLMGLQMAAAYCGSLFFPPFAGLILENISSLLFPVLVGILVCIMTFCLNTCDKVCATIRGEISKD